MADFTIPVGTRRRAQPHANRRPDAPAPIGGSATGFDG